MCLKGAQDSVQPPGKRRTIPMDEQKSNHVLHEHPTIFYVFFKTNVGFLPFLPYYYYFFEHPIQQYET